MLGNVEDKATTWKMCAAPAGGGSPRRLEPGNIKEALRATGAIGNDKLQRRTQGDVVPDSFTHGSSEAARAVVPQRLRNGRHPAGR